MSGSLEATLVAFVEQLDDDELAECLEDPGSIVSDELIQMSLNDDILDALRDELKRRAGK